MSKLERDFQSDLKKDIRHLLPGCYVFKTDPSQKQGIADLLILYEDKWAALEVKRSASASHRPNQDYYVEELDKMSFARFIYPENKEEVLNELQRALQPRRKTRLPRS